jgi:hypothetical protein
VPEVHDLRTRLVMAGAPECTFPSSLSSHRP